MTSALDVRIVPEAADARPAALHLAGRKTPRSLPGLVVRVLLRVRPPASPDSARRLGGRAPPLLHPAGGSVVTAQPPAPVSGRGGVRRPRGSLGCPRCFGVGSYGPRARAPYGGSSIWYGLIPRARAGGGTRPQALVPESIPVRSGWRNRPYKQWSVPALVGRVLAVHGFVSGFRPPARWSTVRFGIVSAIRFSPSWIIVLSWPL